MSNVKNKFQIFEKRYFPIAGVLLLLLLAVFLLWFNNTTSTQAGGVTPAQVCFNGEYCIEGGEWHPIEKGKHIPSTKGDVTLRLEFYLMDPNGNPMNEEERVAPLAFYTDHIGLTFYAGGKIVHVIDNENPVIGESACGENWTMHAVKAGGNAAPTEIVVHNPHSFGNEKAIDEMLSSIAIWANMDFEKEILSNGEPQRNAGMLLMLVAIVFLGIALFSSLIHIKRNKIIHYLSKLGTGYITARIELTVRAVDVALFNH